ncbi:MAG: matrixin family metalloprotease [Candidatus Saccharibacteria bacterium]
MQKRLAILVLSLFVIVLFAFIILRSASLGPEDNYFNARLRPVLASWPFSRKILALHYDGDARSDFLGKRYAGIQLEIDVMSGEELPQQGLDQAVKAIETVTGKPVSVRYSDNRIPYQGALTDAGVAGLAKANRYAHDPDSAFLYLLLASSRDSEVSNIGETQGEDGIIIFMDSLKSFLSRNPDLLPAYFSSTMLHEFGHQLGLPHNSEPGCLMNPEVEGGASWETPADVINYFCPYELRQLGKS